MNEVLTILHAVNHKEKAARRPRCFYVHDVQLVIAFLSFRSLEHDGVDVDWHTLAEQEIERFLSYPSAFVVGGTE